jgi:WD40 repeat protein
VVYSYDPDGNGVGDVIDVFHRRSCNNGASWGPEVRLNDDGTTTDQWFPTVSIGPANIAVSTWYDRRNDPAGNYLFDYYKAYSMDGGVTWGPNIRVTDVSSAVPILFPNFDPIVAACYHGDYDQQVQDDEFVYIQWSDDRNTQNGHPDPDVWFEKEPTVASVPSNLFGAAHAGPNGLSTLYTIDVATGTAFPVGPIGFERVGGMDFGPDGKLYATAERADGSNTPVLISIDTVTGAGSEIGPTGMTGSIGDLSFRSDGVLFAFDAMAADHTLYTVDTATGAATLVGSTGLSSSGGNGMAFSPGDVLYHSNRQNLHTLNQTTGLASVLGPLVYSPPADNDPRLNAKDFDPATGHLFASLNDGAGSSKENYLAGVNLTTMAVTIIGPTVDGLDAIAFRPRPPVNIYGAAHIGRDGLSTLYKIDPASGFATMIGPIGFERVSAIDFGPDGNLYGTGERADGSNIHVFIAIDTASGAGTEIGPTGVEGLGFGDTIADISFRNGDGALYAYLEAGDGLGTIDPSTGAATALGSTGVSCCGNGMAFSSTDTLLHANQSDLHSLNQSTGSATVVTALNYPPPADNFPRINAMDFSFARH